MIKIGMLIGDRYEILEKIGTGGMSDVYKAKCHKLNRFVAVKVLKQEFSENTNFVSKFRVEAQAAAGLMHPNIVNVYDVGEENGIYYIVMELVEGITLKRYIEKKARLAVKEAVSIAIQVSLGIESAHNNHIIHRDIKPQNIIISKDGKVKVTDFGIAKAATSNTISSNVMGSVHYTSPEQARGGYSDEKSDIYSLGITMYEMLTGRVPFNGETTVAIAIMHIQDEMPSPREYVGEIPVSVEQIVLKCTQKSPDRRYQSIAELVEDLKRSLLTPDEDFVKLVDLDEASETKAISDHDYEKIKKQSAKRDHYENEIRANTGRISTTGKIPAAKVSGARSGNTGKIGNTGRIQTGKQTKKSSKNEPQEDQYDPKMEHITTILAVIAAVFIGLVVIFLAGRAVGIFDFDTKNLKFWEKSEESNMEATMPAVVGKTLNDAKEELRKVGIDFNTEYKESSQYPADTVIAANVEAGKKVDVSMPVQLTVSSGVNGATVPDITGKSLAEATATLERDGFSVNKQEGHSTTVEKGNVINQTPAGNSKAPRGSVVSITVSLGADGSKIKMPDVVGMTEMDATVTLTELGLVIRSVVDVEHEDPNMAGKVVYQSYSVGTYVDAKAEIDLKVSTGPKAATFSYNASIESPVLEDPAYKSGTEVTVVLTTAEGQELLRTTTTSFPMAVNYNGIKGSGTGVITFAYSVTTDSTTTTNEAGETVTVPGSTEQKTATRAVAFTQE